METRQPLVTPAWLLKHLADRNLVILDASVDKIVGKSPIEYQDFICIPDAVKIDLDKDFHDADSSLPHTFPPVSQFNQQAQKLGINNDTTLVIYDNQGIYSAPRAWWMFKAMGLENVFVLDGGLPRWLEAQYPTENHYKVATAGNFVATPQQNSICNAQDVLAETANDNTQIIDVRAKGRFLGQTPEPRAGLRSGHIPSSVNLPFAEVLTANGLTYRPNSELLEIFASANITDSAQQSIFSCGSGMTACIVLLAAYHLGFEELRLYDGSWTEWGADPQLPIEV